MKLTFLCSAAINAVTVMRSKKRAEETPEFIIADMCGILSH